MKNIKIACITRENSLDKNQWSGTSYNIYKCLLNTGFNVIRIGPINSYFEKFFKILEKIYKIFNIKYDPERSIFLSKLLANKIHKEIIKKKIDLILVHDCPLISFLKTEIPIIIWTDLTFDLYHKTYFSKYSKFNKKCINNGDYLENKSLNKAKRIIYSTNYSLTMIVASICSKLDVANYVHHLNVPAIFC